MLIAIAIGLSLMRLFLFVVEFYRTDLEKKIFELTSIPVKIGKLQANLRGINPEIILKEIDIPTIDEQEKPSLELEQVRVGIDLRQLLSTRQLLPSSWLTLVGAKVSIVRKKNGKISVVGLNNDDSGQPLWLLNGGRYEVLKSEITWLDHLRQRQPVTFNNVDLLIKNDADKKSHELHLLTQLPKHYGDKLRVSLSVQGNISKMENIAGWVYVEGEAIHLTEVFKEEEFFKMKIANLLKTNKNKSSFKVWSQWDESSLKSLSGSIQVENLALKKNKKTLNINFLDTDFKVSTDNTGWKFGVKNFAIATRKHQWPLMEFSISANQQLTHLAASASQVELQPLTELTQFFASLDKEKQTFVSDLGLKGQLKDFSIFVDKDAHRYAVNGTFKNISVNAMSGSPQIKNLTGTLKGTNENGIIDLLSSNGSFSHPKILRKGISIENLAGAIEWQQLTDTWFVKSKEFILVTKDFETKSELSLTIPKNDKAIFMDLQTSFGNIKDVRSLSSYYPVSIMKKKTVDWLNSAFVSGEINKGNLLVYGELDQFPFANNQGVFEVLFQAKKVELNYSPEWPHLKNMDAKILFNKNGMTTNITKASSHGVKLMNATVKIPSFNEEPHLFIQGQLEGGITDVMGYLQQTPVHEIADKVLDTVTPEGLTQIDLGLEIPLSDDPEVKLNGVAHMKEAGLKINAINLDITDIEGDLKFSEKGVFSDNLKANSLGYPLSTNVHSEELKTVITVNGETDYFQLKEQFSFLKNDLIKNEQITGSSSYTVTVNLPKTENNSAELAIKTNLLGMDIHLPGSLKKIAQQETPLLVTMPLNEGAFLPVSINYKDELKAGINVNRQQSTLHSAHIVYGKGEALIPEKKGIVVHINQDIFNGTEWMEFINQASSNKEEDAVKKEKREQEANLPPLNHLVLKIKEFQWQEQNCGSLELLLQQQEEKWQGNILSSFARGTFSIPFNRVADNNIKLVMKQLNLTQLMSIKLPNGEKKSDTMPLIDITSQQLWWKSINLGSLEIATEKTADGIKFKHINLTSKDYKIKLNGNWRKTDTGSVTNMQGDIKAKKIGKLLSQLKITDDIKKTQGELGFTASWEGLPYQLTLPEVDAEIDLVLKDGRISSIKPGFGRLLGLLAMEQWIKRLSLDFSDVFKSGLSFNKIKGQLKLRQGKLNYKDLLVDAIPAHISISGGINLLEKTLNQKVSVIPKSSAAIPIAGPIVEGIAGAITQVFDKNYKEGYFFGSEYKVQGKWSDLKVTPIQN